MLASQFCVHLMDANGQTRTNQSVICFTHRFIPLFGRRADPGVPGAMPSTAQDHLAEGWCATARK
jgi:hypothetical protein